jgi:hypothetical protein
MCEDDESRVRCEAARCLRWLHARAICEGMAGPILPSPVPVFVACLQTLCNDTREDVRAAIVEILPVIAAGHNGLQDVEEVMCEWLQFHSVSRPRMELGGESPWLMGNATFLVLAAFSTDRSPLVRLHVMRALGNLGSVEYQVSLGVTLLVASMTSWDATPPNLPAVSRLEEPPSALLRKGLLALAKGTPSALVAPLSNVQRGTSCVPMKAESDKMENDKGAYITEMIRTRTVCATVPCHAFEVDNLDVVCLVVKGIFVKAMEDELKTVRQEVCRTLQRLVVKYREDIVTKSAVSLLADALADPAKEVRQSAVVALTKVSSHYTTATIGSVGRLCKKRKLNERGRRASSDSDRRIFGVCREPLCWLTDAQLCQLLCLSRDKTFVRFKIVLKYNPRTTHLA